ncbi:uncharacterized protein LOC113240636 [Hyposmocoma kahamanoa]|uniref:uncharacterized protein LOC113240636 n=1 Tax=Hyposmocoma kahamanoa TaxID=1477025 RepID=UPI000E6D8311|nr:uncharacterized protein LOC113240636 [Hyposmocoma kahamanoa]
MPPPTELSFEEILKFMLAHNGKVTNHALVKHFKVFLMNSDKKDEARSTFKKHVNTLAIIKNQNNEKLLILKKKYFPKEGEEAGTSKVPDSPSAPVMDSPIENNLAPPPYRPPPPLQLNQDFNILSNLIPETASNTTLEMPYNVSKESLASSVAEEVPPKIHPRRKSSDKSCSEKRSSIASTKSGHRSSIPNQDVFEDENMPPALSTSKSDSMLVENEQTISVKERKKMFNRMASESDVLKSNRSNTTYPQSVDEEDRASKGEADPLDSKQKQWILCAARGEYHALAKMCKENPKLVKTKDPFTVSAAVPHRTSTLTA